MCIEDVFLYDECINCERSVCSYIILFFVERSEYLRSSAILYAIYMTGRETINGHTAYICVFLLLVFGRI